MDKTGDKGKVITFRGKEFTIIENLTIAEDIAMKAQRNSLCLGQYAELIGSPIPDEFNAAAFAHAIAEIDARIIKAPDDWNGASNLTDNDFLTELFKEIARACGQVFPAKPAGTDEETEGIEKDGSKESVDELEKEVVPGEIQSESQESGIPDNDRSGDTD